MKITNTPPTNFLTDDVAACAAELDKLRQRERDAHAEEMRLTPSNATGSLDDKARRADEELVSAAIRSGKSAANIGTPNADRLGDERAAAINELAAIRTAIAHVSQELLQLIRRDTNELTTIADTAVRSARSDYVKALDDAVAARKRLCEADGVLSYLDRAQSIDRHSRIQLSFNPRTGEGLKSRPGAMNVTFSAAIGAMRDDATGPAAKR